MFMILIDKNIRNLSNDPDSKLIENYNEECLNSISYDLRVENIYVPDRDDDNIKSSYGIEPNESVFVSSIEILNMPLNLVGKITLKNSRIREGLTVDAPIYQPGHKTRVYVRLTNVSSNTIHLKKNDKVVSIVFEELKDTPERPYNGEFKDEFVFKGLGNYKDLYTISQMDKKIDDIKNIEKNMYSVVITIITIFVSVFSLINTNLDILRNNTINLFSLIIYNLVTIGSIGLLMFFVLLVMPNGKSKFTKVLVLAVPVFAILLACLLLKLI